MADVELVENIGATYSDSDVKLGLTSLSAAQKAV